MLKKKSTKILLAILTILIGVLGALEAKTYIDAKNKKQVAKVTTKQIGPYTVNAEQNDYQKQIETTLLAALESGDAVNITSEVSKYFISDYFTLSDKANFNNVGGMGFVFPATQAKFKVNAIDSYYRDLETFKSTYGQENLPLVKSVTVGTPVKIDNNKIEVSKNSDMSVKVAYDIPVTWEYEENDKLSSMNVVNKATLRFVYTTDKEWYIYEIVGNE